jgi:DNA-directed RNA polymerase specialized sigma24 family protein
VDATADVGLEEVERRARLFRLVDRLPADQRRAVAMRFAEEKSNARSRRRWDVLRVR